MNPRESYPLEFIAASSCLVGLAISLLVVVVDFSNAETLAKVNYPPIQEVAAKPVDISIPAHYLGLTQAGCAASTCHGQPSGDEPSWKNAALIFERNDPHAKAYDVLFSDRSKRIIARLTRQESSELDPYLNVLEQKCIGCHATQLPPGITATSSAGLAELSQGVSCESCHGPASRWRDEHLKKSWSLETAAYPWAGQGFNDLSNSLELAQTCVACHIGGDEKASQVTHDMIAAGHPKLDIEVSAWRNKMPAHWLKTKSKHEKEIHTLRWTEGQLSVALRREELAKLQSADRIQESVWPEFAHLECASCHQSLQIVNSQSPIAAADAIRVAEHLWIGALAMPDIIHDGNIYEAFISNEGVESNCALYQATMSEFLDANLQSFVKPDQLAQILLDHRSEINSWDRLIAWTYAAQAVMRDVENGEFDQSVVIQLKESLQKLSEHIDAAVTSRYASPKVRPADASSETVQEIKADVEQVAKSLALLFPNTPK